MVFSKPVGGFVGMLMDAGRFVPDRAFGRVLEPDDDWYRAAVVDDALRVADRNERGGF